jgi:hypothetical protein
MILKDMNEMINENEEDDTLYNLVRGGKSNLLVTNVAGEREYRPQRPRMTVMMAAKPESNNGIDYRPRKNSSPRGESSDSSSEGEDSSESDDSTSEEGGSDNEGKKQRGGTESLTFQAILSDKDVEESSAEGKQESSCGTPSSYREALLKELN